MEFTKLKQALAAEAKAAGICEQWYYYILRATNKESLIALFNKGLDFCINKRFPSAELRAEFDGLRQHFGIYDSEEFTANNLRRVVAYGTAAGRIKIANFGVSLIWARDNSTLRVEAKDNAFVCINVADSAKVEIEASDAARVSIVLHGGTYTSRTNGAAQIKVINKQ